jgi:Ser/Thr protein kinase RdoA (MazF antagonist)
MTEAEEAARAFGGTAPRLIKARENAVYEVMLPAGRAALRLHRAGYQSAAAIRSELWWCAELAAAGVPVARPLAARDGALLVALSSGRLASAVAWVDGVALGEAGVPLAASAEDQVARHRALGRLIAQLHTATDSLVLPPGFVRPRWDEKGLLGEAPFWGRFWDHPALLPQEATLMRQTRDFLRARLRAHAATGSFGLIHADVLRENVFVSDKGLSLIDFDDSGFGFRLYDLGTVLSQNLFEPALPAIAQALVEGYGETRAVDGQMVAVFTLMRCCASVGWTMPRLAADDPIHRSHIKRALGLAQSVLDGGGLAPLLR